MRCENGKTARIGNLRHAMKLLSSIYVAVSVIRNSGQMDRTLWAETIQNSEILRDPSFHEFLDERARFAADHKHASAEIFAQMASYMRICCKASPQLAYLKRKEEDETEGDAKVAVRIPISRNRLNCGFSCPSGLGCYRSTLHRK